MPSSISSSEPLVLGDAPSVPAPPTEARGGSARLRPWLPFATAALLLVVYQTAVALGAVPRSEGVGEMSANRVIIERCLYRRDPAVDLALAGSSCTQALRAEYLGGDVANLGLSRQSGATGVELIRRLSLKPRVLAVEMGEALWFGENRELLDEMLEPRRRWIHAHLPILRDEYRPAGVFLGAIKREYAARRTTDGGARPDKAYTRLMIRRYNDSTPPALRPEREAKLIREAESLREKIDALRADSVRVVLHRIPRDPLLDAAPQQKRVRAILEKIFPADRYEWVPDAPGEWETKDGYHLTPSSAAAYARYLNRYLGR